ncbi:ribosome biogenesis protein Ytm1 [Schizosaccharomyces cryophilus OY26]|uniref:Ribosome biogenesis protein YTM1 n=1 Tax=Schizosaccharomyces cryophilus (strain OY26 / ATCC MYA-4695 / CBS 11777 / NBRC 106824 / NRRL Y48691) TaxID=653667 RepID=S9VY78_SCHCR|nr:ribosome biogenesis protein Ytm1 [Schizosaccharomyces cryophilus OY26]EPY52598.1 ribosome biogenesis protein Ytm1 [Schizosaccharomyces cryophilus OY26]
MKNREHFASPTAGLYIQLLPTPMETKTNPTGQVQVRFTTRNPELTVGDTPILIPTSLKRYGLSQVVNHLLKSDKPTPFDFLIQGNLLRTSLDDYITQNGLSTESTLDLEYIESTLPPQYLAAFPHDDWISSVQLSSNHILTSSYDGIARVWDKSGQVKLQSLGLGSSLKNISWKAPEKSFLTSSLDQKIHFWEIEDDLSNIENEKSTAAFSTTFTGHKGVVERVRALPESNVFLSASTDKTVGIWDFERSPETTVESMDVNSSKRRRKNDELVPRNGARAPLFLCEGHNESVMDVIFSNDPSAAYSVGLDHTIKTWDLITGQSVTSRITKNPLLCVEKLNDLHLLACGSSARSITLHDPRASSDKITSMTLSGHKNLVSDLAASPENPYMFASVSHDNSCRVWDVRATSGSIYTLPRSVKRGSQWDKLFSVDWNKSVGIVTGGTDKQLQINQSSSFDNSQ